MRIRVILSFIILSMGLSTHAQQPRTLSGYVTDRENGEKLIGAVIFDSINNHHIITTNYGFFSIKLSNGQYYLKTSYVGYQQEIMTGNITRDSVINIMLAPGSSIEEVVIKGTDHNHIISSSNPGLIRMPLKMIQQLPSILGERDILKSIQHLPGVQQGSEGATGYYVRGGGYDNNLILLDGNEVFNPDHLFGFFSFFNDEAIKSVKFYKSGFPAQYNGRAASVLDIRTKDGDENKFKSKATVGLLSSKLQVEGPLIKNKLTFMASARRTYLDLFSKKIISKFTDYDDAGYYFYDVNGKIRWKINDRNSFYISNYFGKDDGHFQSSNVYGENPPEQDEAFNLSESKKTINWGSNLMTARVERIISPALFMNIEVGFSNYNYLGVESYKEESAYRENSTLVTGSTESSLTTRSKVKMQVYSIDFDHSVNHVHHVTYGTDYKQYRLQPYLDSAFLSMESSGLTFISKKISLYAQDEIKAGNKLTIIPGINSHVYFMNSETYFKLDKRFLINYAINDKLSINSSYSELTQHLHLLRLGRINLASDLWLPSSQSIKPTYSTDYSAGFNLKVFESFRVGINAYLRTYKNLVYYREGIDFDNLYNNLAEIVTSGKGTAMGIEFSVEKSYGSLTGLCSYSYSKSERTVPDINNGETFRSQYDRPHNFSLLLHEKLNEHWSLSCLFKVMSGSLQTLAIGKYDSNFDVGVNPWSKYGGSHGDLSEVLVYKRNSLRLPLYHRLDISVNYTIEKQNFAHKIYAGLYNAYNSQNIYEVQTQLINEAYGATRVQLTEKVLFPIIPFISYSIEIK